MQEMMNTLSAMGIAVSSLRYREDADSTISDLEQVVTSS